MDTDTIRARYAIADLSGWPFERFCEYLYKVSDSIETTPKYDDGIDGYKESNKNTAYQFSTRTDVSTKFEGDMIKIEEYDMDFDSAIYATNLSIDQIPSSVKEDKDDYDFNIKIDTLEDITNSFIEHYQDIEPAFNDSEHHRSPDSLIREISREHPGYAEIKPEDFECSEFNNIIRVSPGEIDTLEEIPNTAVATLLESLPADDAREVSKEPHLETWSEALPGGDILTITYHTENLDNDSYEKEIYIEIIDVHESPV